MKKQSEKLNKSNAAIIAVILVIALVIGYEFYTVTHIKLKTQTAVVSTVYEKINADALIVRNEKTIQNADSGVTVACFNDGDKAKVGANIGMVFSSNEKASDYAKYLDYHTQLSYYEGLQSQTIGQSSDLQTANKDIEQKVISYSDALSNGSYTEAEQELNSSLVKKELVIGEEVDLQSHISQLTTEAAKYEDSAPDSYITTDSSGVYYNYTDGYESLVDYDKATDTTVDEFNEYMSQIKSEEKSDNASNLGKLVTGYDWYIQALVPSDKVQNIKNGSTVEVALSDNHNLVLKATVVTGAEPSLEDEQTLLVLSCNVMNDDVARLRKTEIEIRTDTYEGIKVPNQALHIVDGKKGVYVLIASQVKFREADVIYNTDDYALVKYDTENEDAIHLYDKIITQGKDLENGKVYT